RVERAHKRICSPTTITRLWSFEGGKVAGRRGSRQGDSAAAVHRDAEALVVTAAAQIGGIDESGATGVELAHEDVVGAARGGGLQWVGGGKVRGGGQPGHIAVAAAVHRDIEARLATAAAQIGGVDQRRAGRVQLADKRVEGPASIAGLRYADGGGEDA